MISRGWKNLAANSAPGESGVAAQFGRPDEILIIHSTDFLSAHFRIAPALGITRETV